MSIADNISTYFWAHVQVCVHGFACSACCWPWTGTQWKGYGIITVYDIVLETSPTRAPEGERSVDARM